MTTKNAGSVIITPIVRGNDAMLSTPHLAASYVTFIKINRANAVYII